MIRTRVFLATLAGAGLLASVHVRAQVTPYGTAGEEPLRRVVSPNLELWMSAVKSHSPGRDDGSVALIASWSRNDLENVVAEAKGLPFVDGPLRKRAAVLHADIAVLHRTAEGYSLPPDERSVAFVRDGRFVGRRTETYHWRIGRGILDVVEPDPDVLLWYRATSAFLQSCGDYSEIEDHLKRARDRFPRDGVLLLYEGTLHAAYAAPRVQSWLRTVFPEYNRDPRPIGNAREELQEAERRFKKALELDPDLAEARIRLAYVRALRGHHEEAAADLRRVVERDLGNSTVYLAWLLLGREEAALGRREAARRAFTRAMRLYPEAQSPRLGLSLLARVEGNRTAARQVLGLLSSSVTGAEDPWWSFDNRHEPDAEELLAETRRRLAP